MHSRTLASASEISDVPELGHGDGDALAESFPRETLTQRIPSIEDIESEIKRRGALRARDSLLAFTAANVAGFRPGRFHALLCRALERFARDVAARRSPRLILTVPPRHGKSEIASRNFPPWIMAKYGFDVILASYGQELANELSEDARAYARSETTATAFPWTVGSADATATGRDRAAKDDVKRWRLRAPPRSGRRWAQFKAAGLSAGITGSGGDVLIIDDPIKGREDADSATIRDRVWKAYASAFRTRAAPGGGVIVITTRWHEDDLAGRLIAAQDDGGERWQILNFPAIAEDDEFDPETGELFRERGEALHAERYDLAALESIRSVDPLEFESLYQQNPVPAAGVIFESTWIAERYTAPPDPPPRSSWRVVQAWDTAQKKGKSNDYSACVTLLEYAGRIYVLDVLRRRLSFPELMDAIKAQAEIWRPSAVIVEDASSGSSAIQQLRADGTPISVIEVRASTDKVSRANAETPALRSGRLILPAAAGWLAEFVLELLRFPGGKHDDQVDALIHALHYLRGDVSPLSAWRNVARNR
jgi:predicted phage terminase large subunit-like protein